MLASSALYSLLVPKLWNYAQQNIINISSPALGSSLFEISASKNVMDVSYLLDNSKQWVLNADATSRTSPTITSEGFVQEPHQKHEETKTTTTLLLELYLVCNVRKVVLDFNRQALPSELEISYSSNEKKINFRKLAKLRNTELKRSKPFVIYFTKPVQLKYMKFKIVIHGHSSDRNNESAPTTSCKLNSIKLFGTPVLSTDNLFDLYHKNQDQLKALAEMIGLTTTTKEASEYEKENSDNSQQSSSTKDPSDSEEGITIEILPDDDKNASPKVNISDPRNRASKLIDIPNVGRAIQGNIRCWTACLPFTHMAVLGIVQHGFVWSLITHGNVFLLVTLHEIVEHSSSSNIDLFNELSKNEAFLQKAIGKDSK